jgi:hypothetical protein
MRKSVIVSLFILSSTVLLNAEQGSIPSDQIATMTWLEGEWLGTFAGSPFWASYSSPKGGVILSISKDLTPGKEPCYIEFERFTYDDTSVFLIPYPDGKPHSLKFRLAGASFDPAQKKAIFRNAENDWPTDLAYQRVSEDSLIITLSGPGEEGRGTQELSARLGLIKSGSK